MSARKVLIVDDEESIRLTLSCTLEDLGLEVEAVADGERALDRLRAEDFELVFLDLRLPGIDGMEVLRQAHTLRPNTQVFVMTAYDTLESRVDSLKLGARGFIQKPFTANNIRQVFLRRDMPD
ncbi:response regulator [bacterium]|nr:response regulator [bacterium]